MTTLLEPARLLTSAPTLYRSRLTCGTAELHAAQALRYNVFNLELNEGLAASAEMGRDEDPFDEFCDHLIVEHVPSGEIVGTYRLQTGRNAAAQRGYYSEQEFDFAPFESMRSEIIELGRACVHQQHRNLVVLGMLWKGIADYAKAHGGRYLCGCSSLTSQDPAVGASAYTDLCRRNLAPMEWRTRPLPRFECSLEQLAGEPVKIPKLLRAYLSMGAKICGSPAIDREFKTIDFLTLLDLEALPALVRGRFLLMICNGLERVRSTGRAMLRGILLSAEIFRGAAAYRCRKSNARDVHARWLHRICRQVLRAFAIQSTIIGTVPKRGLLVANHLSYLDVVLLGSLTPCVFVAKSEVKGWPVFGWFARMAGTVFVNRNNRRDAARANETIRAALREGALVVLFPEGTSSDGSMVLPFKSSLLESAIGERVPISVAALRYELPDGDAGAEVCYWGGHTLVPHLIKLLSKREVKASVAFSEVTNTWRDRKKLAAQLHSEVSQLHDELRGSSVAVEATRLTAAAHRSSGEIVSASSHRLLQEMAS